jgi:hypothetical protein
MLFSAPGRRLAAQLFSLSLVLALFLAAQAFAAPPVPLKLPAFEGLAQKATQSVTITLDEKLLKLAAGFLGDDPDEAAAKDVVRGLKGIYVRSYTFDSAFDYPVEDVDAVRKQLAAPGWQSVVTVRNTKERTQVDIYVSVEEGATNGLAIIASEPREFTVVNIVGNIDLAKLHRLEGKFGVPHVPDEDKK